jgi:hypothetical protein
MCEGKAPGANLGKTEMPVTILPEVAFDFRPAMTLPIRELAIACRTFMDLAYAQGPHTIPDSKKPYGEIPHDAEIGAYLPPAACAAGVCQDLSKLKGGVTGFEFRLGSADHPHLKLRIQQMELHGRQIWVYSVDTHDRFLQATQHLSAEEAEAWKALVEANRALKHQIEAALANAGFMTPISVLKLDLTSPTA